MNSQLDTLGCTLSNPQQLDPVSQLLCITDILTGEFSDALGIDLVELHRNTKSDRGHDGEFMGSIDTLDIECRVGLRIAQLLRLIQNRIKCQSLVPHLRQNKVTGSIDDSSNPLDTVSGQTFPQRLDDRDPTRHRSLERDHHTLLLSGCKDLSTV